MKKIITKEFTNNMLITAGFLFLTTILSFILFFYISRNPVNTTLFYFSCMLTLSLIISASLAYIRRQSRLLATQQKQLAETKKEKMNANLLRAVSHDLRTPLTNILDSVALLEEHKRSMPMEHLEMIHNIRDDANWLLHMAENILSVTKIENTSSKLNTVPEIVDEVVAESVTRLHARIPDADIKVSLPSDILLIPMDAMLIEQVLINLLENAIIHSNSRESVLLAIEEHANHVSFRIIDYGIGLNESMLEHIFDGSYTQNSPSSAQKGIGIGLSICHTIITAHQGTISAHNHAKGAEFVFSLPKEAFE